MGADPPRAALSFSFPTAIFAQGYFLLARPHPRGHLLFSLSSFGVTYSSSSRPRLRRFRDAGIEIC